MTNPAPNEVSQEEAKKPILEGVSEGEINDLIQEFDADFSNDIGLQAARYRNILRELERLCDKFEQDRSVDNYSELAKLKNEAYRFEMQYRKVFNREDKKRLEMSEKFIADVDGMLKQEGKTSLGIFERAKELVRVKREEMEAENEKKRAQNQEIEKPEPAKGFLGKFFR